MKIGGVDINRKVGGVQVNEVRLGGVLIWSSFTGLLDTYTNAASAYSLRKLRNNYSGSCIRVRRTDNAELDIGFVNNELDTTSLLTFVGSGDGSVVTWYDQKGSSNPTQSSAVLQPKIVSSGVVNLENGKPTILFSNNSLQLASSPYSEYASNTIVSVAKSDSTTEGNLYNFSSSTELYGLTYNRTSSNSYAATSFISEGSSTFGGDFNGQSLIYTLHQSSLDTFINSVQVTDSNDRRAILNANFIGSRDASFPMNGNIQELILFNIDQAVNQVAIETNINDHYSIYATLLLDLYPDAAAAYSLRRLRTAYSGSAIRVRRTDNTEQDIGFANNELDTVSLLSFVGSGNGFIVTWYDQSGNSNDVTNSTASLQPQVVSSGVVETLNSKPTALANSSILLSSATTITDGSGQLTTFSVSKPTTATTGVLFGARSAGALLGNFPKIISTGNIQNLSFNTPSGFTQSQTSFTLNTTNLFTCFRRTGNLQNYVNGSEGSVVSSGTPLNGDTAITIFARSDASLTEPFDGYGSEFIIYPKDSTTDRAAIETNINDYYSIYDVNYLLANDGFLLQGNGDKIII